MTQHILVCAPRLELQLPEDWEVSSNPQAMAAFTGPTRGGFLTNVVVQQQRVDPSVSLDALAAVLLDELRVIASDANVRNAEAKPGQRDRVIDFSSSGIPIVTYQRLLLVAGTQSAHWLVVVEGTCHAPSEAELGPVLAAIIASVSVS